MVTRILIVDDSSFARLNVGKIVRSAGYDVIEAADGAEGVEKVRSERPACVVTDLLMPVLDGTGLLRTLREEGDRTPVIVLTADIQETKRQECLDLGALDFLGKPPKRELLLQRIAEAVGN